jgi:hypothetical protein
VSCQIGLELTALADGTLAAERRIALLRKIAASPNLAQALAQQMLAVEAIRRLDTRAPTELRERIQRGTATHAQHRNAARPPNDDSAHGHGRLLLVQTVQAECADRCLGGGLAGGRWRAAAASGVQ